MEFSQYPMLIGIIVGVIMIISGLLLWVQLGLKYPVKHPLKFLCIWVVSPLLLVLPLLFPLLEKIPPLRREDRKALKKARAERKSLDAMSTSELRLYYGKERWAENFKHFGLDYQKLDPSSQEWEKAAMEERLPDDVNTMINDVVETSVDMSWADADAATLGDYLIEERKSLHATFEKMKEIFVAHFDFEEEEAEDYLIDQVSYGMMQADLEYKERNIQTPLRNLAEDYFIPVTAS